LFSLLVVGGLVMFYRGNMAKQLTHAISTGRAEEGVLARLRSKPATSLETVVSPFQKVLPRSTAEVTVIQQRLIRAGFRETAHLNIFYGLKVLVPAGLAFLATVTGLYEQGAFFVYAVAVGIGFLVPDFALGNMISARQLNIRLGLCDFLDLMVVCIEAGLSLDQSMIRTSEELGTIHPALADELGLVILEQRAGLARSEAWTHLAERTDIPAIRTLVSLLIQADQFGTSVAKTLRTHSDTLRTQRRQHVEEQAAKTTVKLVFPLVLFIFPSIFVVTLGPAFLLMADAFSTLFV
jgi:tight adherence protein C